MHRGVDVLSAPRFLALGERRKRPEHRVVGGDVAGVVFGRTDRRRALQVVITAGTHRTAQRQPDAVGPGPLRPRPVLPERRDRQHDQPRVGVGQQHRVEGTLQRRLRRLQHDVGFRGKSQKELQPVVGGDVQRQRALVGVVVPPEERALGTGQILEKGADPPPRVAGRRLDLDHVRSEVGEQPPGVLPERIAQIQHPHAV